jgi:hypothetical protein
LNAQEHGLTIVPREAVDADESEPGSDGDDGDDIGNTDSVGADAGINLTAGKDDSGELISGGEDEDEDEEEEEEEGDSDFEMPVGRAARSGRNGTRTKNNGGGRSVGSGAGAGRKAPVAAAATAAIERAAARRTGSAMHGARFPTEIYTRGCHWIPRMFA